MSKREGWSLTVVVLAMLALLTPGLYLRWFEGQMDTTLSVQIIDNFRTQGRMVMEDVGLRKIFSLLSMPPEQVCKLRFVPPPERYESVLAWHTYLILALLAPFSYVIDTKVLMSLVTAGSFVALLGLAYWGLRRSKVSAVEAFLFTVLISCHPAWSYALFGQLYVDRLFIGLGFLFIFLVTWFPEKRFTILSTGVLCALINDRIGLVCCAFIVGYSVLFWKQSRLKWHGIALGVFLGALSYILMKFVISNQFYGNFASGFEPSAIIGNLQNDRLRHALYVFLLFNFVFIGLLPLFSWRAAILVLGSMVPNLIGTMGGAEKTGWTTHYHSLYFPILVWAAAQGFISLRQHCRLPSQRIVLGSWLVLGCLASAGTDPFTWDTLAFAPANLMKHGLVRTARELPEYREGGYKAPYLAFGKTLRDLIPPGSSVTAPEYVMPLLYAEGGRRIFFYPIGVAQSDYAILQHHLDEHGRLRFYGYTSFLGLSEKAKIDDCLHRKMARLGYDFSSAKVFPNGWAVIPRRKADRPQGGASEAVPETD